MIPGLIRGPRSQAFFTLVDVIRGDKTFANNRVVKTWFVQRSPNIPLSTDMMPAVSLRIVGGEIERLATQAETLSGIATVDIQTTPSLVIETYVAGSDVGDAMDLYDAIDCALFPADPDRRAALNDKLQNVGVSDVQPMRDVMPETLADYDGKCIRSVGMYRITLNLCQ